MKSLIINFTNKYIAFTAYLKGAKNKGHLLRGGVVEKRLRNTVLYRYFVSGIVKKRALNQNKNRNAGNCPYSQNFWGPRNRGAALRRHSSFTTQFASVVV